jgi:hypothetical protein
MKMRASGTEVTVQKLLKKVIGHLNLFESVYLIIYILMSI